jgi:hypothetical protein
VGRLYLLVVRDLGYSEGGSHSPATRARRAAACRPARGDRPSSPSSAQSKCSSDRFLGPWPKLGMQPEQSNHAQQNFLIREPGQDLQGALASGCRGTDTSFADREIKSRRSQCDEALTRHQTFQSTCRRPSKKTPVDIKSCRLCARSSSVYDLSWAALTGSPV